MDRALVKDRCPHVLFTCLQQLLFVAFRCSAGRSARCIGVQKALVSVNELTRQRSMRCDGETEERGVERYFMEMKTKDTDRPYPVHPRALQCTGMQWA